MPIIPGHTITRAQVVREAQRWIGTPYHHGQTVQGPHGGVDCAMLMAGVFSAVGYLPPFDVAHYPPDWFLNNRAERYLGVVLEYAREIEPDQAGAGDVVLFCLGADRARYAHGAIIDAPGMPNIIHASSDARMVRPQQAGEGRLRELQMRFFSIWE